MFTLRNLVNSIAFDGNETINHFPEKNPHIIKAEKLPIAHVLLLYLVSVFYFACIPLPIHSLYPFMC